MDNELIIWVGDDVCLFNKYASSFRFYFYRFLPSDIPKGTRLIIIDEPILSMYFFQAMEKLPIGVPVVIFSSLSAKEIPDLPDNCKIYFKPLTYEEIHKIVLANALPEIVENILQFGNICVGWWYSKGGGDFIRVYNREDKVVFIMGDTEGKNIPAWGDSFRWKAYIDTVMRNAVYPHEIVNHLYMDIQTEKKDMKNCALNVIEVAKDGILFALAGMPAPMVLKEGRWIKHPGRGSLLGGNYVYTYTLPINDIDAIVFYSDGFFDPTIDMEWKIKAEDIKGNMAVIVDKIKKKIIGNTDDTSFVVIKKNN